MPRQLRIQYPGATYHVMARGNRREDIFRDDGDRKRFLKLMGDACQMTGWQIRAFVLMSNHYHWVVHTPEANLVSGMAWFQNAYTRFFNTRHREWGRLFGDRYKSILVEETRSFNGAETARGDYLSRLINYVHLNPARANLIAPDRGESILDFPWSSIALGYALPQSKRPKWLDATTGLELALCRDTVAGRRAYVRKLDDRILAERAEKLGVEEEAIDGQTLNSSLKRGWYWGSQAFRDWLLVKYGEAPVPAERIKVVPREKITHWIEPNGSWRKESMIWDSHLRRICAPGVVAISGKWQLIAWAVWRNTTGVSQAWLAERFGLKSPANVSQLIRRFDRAEAKSLSPKLRKWRKEMSKFVA